MPKPSRAAPATTAKTPTAPAPAKLLPYQDSQLPAEQRITDLIQRMTLDEKLAMLGTDPTIPRLGIVGTNHVEGLHGLALGGPGGWGGRGPGDADHAVPAVARAGPDVGPRSAEAGRRRRGVRDALGLQQVPQGRAGGARAQRRPEPRSALGAHGRVLRRGPVPGGHAGHGLHRGAAGQRPEDVDDRVAAEAFPGQQQRGWPRRLQLQLRRPPLSRVLRGAVPHGHRSRATPTP